MGEEGHFWWVKTVAFILLASLGGTLGYIMRTLDKDLGPIRIRRALLEGIASGFVGMLVMLLCNVLGFNDQWTGVIVGVMGWLGANASIRILESKVMKQLGLHKPTVENTDDNVVE